MPKIDECLECGNYLPWMLRPGETRYSCEYNAETGRYICPRCTEQKQKEKEASEASEASQETTKTP